MRNKKMKEAQEVKNRFDYLDGLRGIAAIIVVMHHGVLFFDFGLYSGLSSDAKFPSWDLWLSGKPILLLFFAGNFSVCVFFLLSGFVLAHIYSRADSSPLELMIKRYIRLTVPISGANLLLLAVGLLTLGLPVLGPIVPLVPGASGYELTLSNAVAAFMACMKESLFTAQFTGIKVPTFNGVLWTMQIEFVGSALLILTFWVARKLRPGSIVPTAAAICSLFIVFEWQSQLALMAAGPVFYWLFGARELQVSTKRELIGGAGIFFGIFLGTLPESSLRLGICNVLLRFSGADPAALLSKSLVPWVPFQFLPVSLWHGAGAVMLLAGVFCSRQMRLMLSSRLALFLGYISFPVYLMQTNVSHLTEQPVFAFLVSQGINGTVAMILAVAFFVLASVGVAFVFAGVFEGRAIRWSGLVSAWIVRPLRSVC